MKTHYKLQMCAEETKPSSPTYKEALARKQQLEQDAENARKAAEEAAAETKALEEAVAQARAEAEAASLAVEKAEEARQASIRAHEEMRMKEMQVAQSMGAQLKAKYEEEQKLKREETQQQKEPEVVPVLQNAKEDAQKIETKNDADTKEIGIGSEETDKEPAHDSLGKSEDSPKIVVENTEVNDIQNTVDDTTAKDDPNTSDKAAEIETVAQTQAACGCIIS